MVLASLGALMCGFSAGYLTAESGVFADESKSARAGGARSGFSARTSNDPETSAELGRVSEAEARIARLCVREALRVRPQREGENEERGSTAIGQDVDTIAAVRDQVDQILVLVMEKGLWSRGAGAKARYLLSQLPRGDAAELRRKLDRAAEEGSVRVQVGAWLPLGAP